MERIIGSSFLRWAFDNDLYGQNQYAYSTGRSHKDALAVNICNWLIMLENGDAIGLYCSDVSGAFDRVRKERLISKLRLSGLNPRIIRFLESWLDDRQSVVVVGGAISGLRTLCNSVFQGTVLGPPLWNVFYKDAAQSIRRCNFTEVVFADDFNTWCAFNRQIGNDEILSSCRECQALLHAWGRTNSVSFDPGKESFHVLHRMRGVGDDFPLLGLINNCSLKL